MIFKKFIRKQLTDFTKEEGMYVLDKHDRDNIMCSAISVECDAQVMRHSIGILREALKEGKDPEFWLISLECDLQHMERQGKIIQQVMR